VGRAAAEESWDELNDHLSGAHMVFITAGMGGGTGTGAAPVIARAAREQGILTVGVVTKPFSFEGNRRTRLAEDGIDEMHRHVDTLIVIPNQNLFRVANEKTTFADAFKMADQVLYSGVGCITDLMVKEGLINLDFADVRAVMRGMGKAMMGTGEASGEDRARHAAEAAIANPLLDDVSMHGARGLLISITGGPDLTLYEVDEAASRIREEVDEDANIILGATFDNNLDGRIRVSVVATGTDATMVQALDPVQPSTTRAPISVKRPPLEVQPQHRAIAQQVQPIENQVQAAVAEAIAHEPAPVYAEDDGVTVEPYIPAALHAAYDDHVRIDDAPVPTAYVPSHAARPDGQRRMPRTEELPAVARRSLDAPERREEEPRNARALFKRLASNVGLGLRGQQDETRDETTYTANDDAAARSAIEAGGARVSRAPEGAAGQLDPHGRPVPPQPQKERLEIPAFLRKHG
jgi:cell division protein FtsZ